MRPAIVVVAGALAVLAAGPPPAAAAPSPTTGTAGRPLIVRAASLIQDGREIVWTVRLEHPFSPSMLRHQHRSLCLLIERAHRATVSGMMCVEPPPGPGRPRLVYMRVSARGSGPGHTVAATVTRSNTPRLVVRLLPSEIGVPYGRLHWQVLSTLAAPACVPRVPSPRGCATLFPARPQADRFHVPQLVGCVAAGPDFVSHGPANQRVIALTFDDGPWPDTPQFLDLLERKHVPATFFQIGEQVSTYGRTVDRRMLADGDIIGDHTFTHANVAGGGSFAAGEIARARGAIQQATGFTPCLFRAPDGAVSSSLIGLARSMGFTTIQWDVDPRDWSRPGTGSILQNVIANAHNGAIVIQHDGGGDRSETLAALPGEIDTLRGQGYRFVTVTQLLGIRLLYR